MITYGAVSLQIGVNFHIYRLNALIRILTSIVISVSFTISVGNYLIRDLL